MNKLTDSQLACVKDMLFPADMQEEQTVYAIADGIQDKEIYKKLIFPGAEYIPLIDDEVFGYKESAPPFLIELSAEPERHWQSATEYLIQHQIGKHTIIFLRSAASLEELNKHLQNYLYPFDDDEHKFMRFYDPRVFPKWIKSITQEDADELFSMISCFWYEVSDEKTLIQFTPSEEKGYHETRLDYENKEPEPVVQEDNDLSHQ